MPRKARSPYAGLRKLLLAALVLIVLAVAGLFLFGKAGLRREAPQREAETRAGKSMTLIGEEFDYTFTEGKRPIFQIRGQSVKADREGTLFLDRVALTLYDREGQVYHVESRKASFNRESNEGALQGNVVLKGPGNLELRTGRLDLRQKGQRVASRGAAEIRYGGRYVAHAGRLTVNLPDEVYVLQEGAKIESLPGVAPPVSLSSQRLVYERKKRWIRVEGGANLRRGEDWLTARRIFGHLADDESGLKFVHGFWDIAGESRASMQPLGSPGAPEPTRVRFSGNEIAVNFQPEANQVRRVELQGAQGAKEGGGGRARLEATGPAVVRTLTARRIEGVLAAGVLSNAEAFGGVDIEETSRPAEKPPVARQASGQWVSASFRPDGQLATVSLNHNVTYRDGPVTATGNRGALDLDEGRGEFVGAPVTIVSDRGKMEAPRVVYNTDQKIASARGGVKAVFQKVEETALEGTPLSEGEGPVHVESQEAFWKQQPSSFLFRGDVRAWRGENLLLAPELRGDKEADLLTGTGGVKTLWFPTPEQTAKAGEPGGSKQGGRQGTAGGQRSRIQVLAAEMSYRNAAGLLVYTGNVRVDQEGRTLSCNRLQVELGEKREAETMTCTGATKLNDPKVGRRVEGERAVYLVEQRRVDIFGDPVVMSDRDGNTVRGKRAVYFIDDGKVEVKGKDDPAPAAAQVPQGTGR